MSDLRKAAQDVVTVWKMYGTAESLRGWMQILESALAQQPEPLNKCHKRRNDPCACSRKAMLCDGFGPPQQPEPAQEPVAQAMQDAAVYGVGISRDGKRIDPASIYEQPAQEPDFHGFMSADGTQVDLCFTPSVPRSDGTYATAYYTHPPQRPPLTDAEMLDIIDDAMEGGSLLDLVRAIERKVRGEA